MAGKLIYIGDGGWFPGWPTADHDEPDEELFALKLSSRMYRSESGKEIKEREAVAKIAKDKANTKAVEIAAAQAIEARAIAKAAEAVAIEAEAKAKPRGRK